MNASTATSELQRTAKKIAYEIVREAPMEFVENEPTKNRVAVYHSFWLIIFKVMKPLGFAKAIIYVQECLFRSSKFTLDIAELSTGDRRYV